jgi:putative restriction endonuclease
VDAYLLRANEYRCAVCAYGGQVGKISVGIEASHVTWFSHGGPDVVENGLSLCSLHHKAFDLGAIAISDDRKVLVSRDFRGGWEWEARFLRVSGAPLVWLASGRASGPCGVCGVPRAASPVRVRGSGRLRREPPAGVEPATY